MGARQDLQTELDNLVTLKELLEKVNDYEWFIGQPGLYVTYWDKHHQFCVAKDGRIYTTANPTELAAIRAARKYQKEHGERCFDAPPSWISW